MNDPVPAAYLHGAALDRDLTRAADGWGRRFVGAPPRLEEMVRLYEELGYEVLVEPMSEQDLADTCAGCRLALSVFRIVYTRRKP